MRTAIVVMLAMLPSACATKDIIVADIGTDAGADAAADASADSAQDATADSPPAPPPGPPCHSNSDCAPNQYCAMNSCGAPLGGCELRPTTCGADLGAVCGCDGVTYWNDCLRARDGVAAGTAGDCSNGVQCTDPVGSTCPVSDGACARLVTSPGACPTNFNGICWVLPDACPTPPPPGPMWLACSAPAACDDLCGAIRAGTPFQRAPAPGTCPAGP